MQRKSRKGEGHIFKRGSIYYLQFSINGKRIVHSLKTKDRVAAQQNAKELTSLNSEIINKELTIIKIAEAKNILSPKRIKVKDIWKTYLDNPSRPDSSESTLKSYKSAINLFVKWIENNHKSTKNLIQVTDEIAGRFANFLWNNQKVSERTYNAYIKALCLVFRVLTKNVSNPFAKENISRKHEKQQKHFKFSDEELKIILNIFNDTDLKTMHKEEMEVLFYIGAFTGLRLIDCCMLKWSKIDFSNKIIKTIPVKTQRIKRCAIIPFPKQLEEKLNKALQWKNNDYVLPNIIERYGRNPDGIRKDIIKILKYAGFKTTESAEGLQRKKSICRYGFHSFRHSYASIMASSGYNINMLSKVLADDIRTLEKYYIHIDDKAIKVAFDKIIPTVVKQIEFAKIKPLIIEKMNKLSFIDLQHIYTFVEELEKT